MVVSQNKGTQYRPQNTIVLIMGTPKKVPLILGNTHMIPIRDNGHCGENPEMCIAPSSRALKAPTRAQAQGLGFRAVGLDWAARHGTGGAWPATLFYGSSFHV